MEAQYLKNNHVTYYVITQGGVYTEQWYVIITSDETWTAGQIKVPELESKLVVHSSNITKYMAQNCCIYKSISRCSGVVSCM